MKPWAEAAASTLPDILQFRNLLHPLDVDKSAFILSNTILQWLKLPPNEWSKLTVLLTSKFKLQLFKLSKNAV